MKLMNIYYIFTFLAFFYPTTYILAQDSHEYDSGFKNVKWGSSVAEAKLLIKEKPHPYYYYTDNTSETMNILGHSYIVLQYHDATNETAANIKYSFIDDKLYSIHKHYYKGDSDIQRAYIESMKAKLNKQYGKGRQSGSVIKWQSLAVSITLEYNYQNYPVLGDSYNDTIFIIESKQYKKQYDTVQKEIDSYEKKKANDKAKKILD